MERSGGISESLVGLTSAELVNVPIPSVIAVDVEKVILAKTAKDSCLVFIDILMIFFFFSKKIDKVTHYITYVESSEVRRQAEIRYPPVPTDTLTATRRNYGPRHFNTLPKAHASSGFCEHIRQNAAQTDTTTIRDGATFLRHGCCDAPLDALSPRQPWVSLLLHPS